MEWHFPYKQNSLLKKCEWNKLCVFVLVVIMSTKNTADAASSKSRGLDYGVIIDAGSSGSRVRVYAWKANSWFPGSEGKIPQISEIHNHKITPGISSYASNSDGLNNHIETLIQQAKGVVHPDKYSKTHIYVLATAGMRRLPEDFARELMNEINLLLLNNSVNPFAYTSLNTRVLSGEEEGVFAWITVNYLRNFFDTTRANIEHAGILELGGASSQIAFLHGGYILADKFPVTIRGKIYPLYTHSYLGFGQNSVEAKLQARVFSEYGQINGQTLNPCMLRDDNLTAVVGEEQSVSFRGTGDPIACLEHINDIVYEEHEEGLCQPQPCGIGTVYQPSIDPNMPFYALSAFTYTLQTLGVINGGDGSFSLADTRQAAIEFCSKDITQVERETGRNDSFLSTECMMGLYIPVLLQKGFKFSNTTRQIHAVESITNQPIEWPLGALIYENERRGVECITAVSSSIKLIENFSLISIIVLFSCSTLY